MTSEAVVDTIEGLGDLPLAWLALLVSDHLDAEGRLKLFAAGKAMSRAVLQHEGAQLTFSAASKQTTAQQDAAQAVAAEANNLAVKLHEQAITLQPCLWPCITSLELRKVTVPVDWEEGLYNLPNLHNLPLKSCKFPPLPATAKNLPYPLPALRKCTLTQCTPLRQTLDHLRPTMAGSQTLTHLVVDDRPIMLVLLLACLPALTALQCTPKETGDDQSSNCLRDDDFATLLAHPKLEHVVLGPIAIKEGQFKQPCKWKTLQLMAGVQDVMIPQLPLAGLETFTLGCIKVGSQAMLRTWVAGGGNMLPQDPGAITANLGSCQRVVFKATKGGGHRDVSRPTFKTVEPRFRIDELSTGVQMSEAMRPGLLSLALMAAEQVQGVLVSESCTMLPDLLGVVRACNPAIHTLCLSNGMDFSPAFNSGLLSSLPSTIRHLIFAGELLIIHIVDVLSSTKAPATLKLITLSVQKSWHHAGVSAFSRQRVDAVAAQHQPHVTLQWQEVAAAR